MHTNIIIKQIHERVPTSRHIHILFQKQAACRRGTKMEKGLFDEG